MFGSEVLDIVIGLIFIYLLYSLLATIIQEIIATHFSLRAKILEKGVMRMLDDDYEKDCTFSPWKRFMNFIVIFKRQRKQPAITKAFYEHPLIKYLGEDKWHSKPAYLSSKNFSKVVIDLLRGAAKPGDDIRSKIDPALKDGKINWGIVDNNSGSGSKPGNFEPVTINKETLSYLQSIWADSQGDVEKFKASLEDWYNETMERVSGWYKKYTQVVLFFVGFVIAIAFNVDTLKIVSKLEKDPVLRQQLVTQADAFVKAHPDLDKELIQQKEQNKKIVFADTTNDQIAAKVKTKELDEKSEVENEKLKQRRDSLLTVAANLVQGDIKKVNNLLGIGYGTQDDKCCPMDVCCQIGSFFKSFFGWLLTAIALSLGAPFWFDLLNKLIKLRGSIKTEPDKDDTASTNQVTTINRKA